MTGMFLIISLSSMSYATDVNGIITAVEQKYKDVNGLRANFVQHTFNPAFQTKITQEGELSIRKPNALRWEFKTPAEKTFVMNGKKVWIWNPALNQVMVSNNFKQKDQMTNLLASMDNLRSDYTFKLLSEDDSSYTLDVSSKNNASFDSLQITISKVEFLMQGMKVSGELTGQMELRLSNIEVNPPLSLDLFDFKAPSGAEVIAIDEM